MITQYGYVSWGLLFIAMTYIYGVVIAALPRRAWSQPTIPMYLVNTLLNVLVYLPVLWIALQSVHNLPFVIGFAIVVQFILTVEELFTSHMFFTRPALVEKWNLDVGKSNPRGALFGILFSVTTFVMFFYYRAT